MPRFRLLHGNAADQLKALPDNSIDSCVTDPPYGLSKEPDAAEVLSKWLAGKDYSHGGGGFMGKSWDSFVPGPNLWREVYRVLKPGGHMLVFAGTRTQDLMGMSLRLAGFEVRDCLTWHYGTGFPKSHNVSKAIDKLKPTDLVYTVTEWLADARETADVSKAAIDAAFGTNGMAGHWCARRTNSQPQVPTADQWPKLLKLLGVKKVPKKVRQACELVLTAKGEPCPNWFKREVTGQHDSGLATGVAGVGGHGEGKERRDIPATDAAAQWEGYGTALKPASEPILMVRKPLSGTIAQTVLEHGTGVLNIDGCRIGSGEGVVTFDRKAGDRSREQYRTGTVENAKPSDQGRWPANVLFSHTEWCDEVSCVGGCPVAELDRQSEDASRFFYVAKPSKRERNYGCDALKARQKPVHIGQLENRKEAETGKRTSDQTTKNNHPTVKPVTLMRYLVRLITPPGGTCLDPFLGSGTTALAAAIEGFDCVGVELTAEYLPIIEARLDGWRRCDPSILTDDEQAALKAAARAAPEPEPADPEQPALDL